MLCAPGLAGTNCAGRVTRHDPRGPAKQREPAGSGQASPHGRPQASPGREGALAHPALCFEPADLRAALPLGVASVTRARARTPEVRRRARRRTWPRDSSRRARRAGPSRAWGTWLTASPAWACRRSRNFRSTAFCFLLRKLGRCVHMPVRASEKERRPAFRAPAFRFGACAPTPRFDAVRARHRRHQLRRPSYPTRSSRPSRTLSTWA